MNKYFQLVLLLKGWICWCPLQIFLSKYSRQKTNCFRGVSSGISQKNPGDEWRVELRMEGFVKKHRWEPDGQVSYTAVRFTTVTIVSHEHGTIAPPGESQLGLHHDRSSKGKPVYTPAILSSCPSFCHLMLSFYLLLSCIIARWHLPSSSFNSPSVIFY